MKTLILRYSAGTLSYRVAERGRTTPLVSGSIRRIGGETDHRYSYGKGRGEGSTDAATPAQAVGRVADLFEDLRGWGVPIEVSAVAYLVPHGDRAEVESDEADETFVDRLRAAIEAGRGGRDALQIIEAGRARYPGLRHVAVADDAFFSGLPPEAASYLLPDALTGPLSLRRRGHRGLLHAGALAKVMPILQAADAASGTRPRPSAPPEAISSTPTVPVSIPKHRIVLCHLERAAGVTAAAGDRPVWTTFGFAAGDGLPGPLGVGSLDVGVLAACLRDSEMSRDLLLAVLANGSGLGLRDDPDEIDRVALEAERGTEPIRTTWTAFVQGMAGAVAAAVSALGGIDALVFLGEGALRSPRFRRAVCTRLGFLGIRPPDEVALKASDPTRLSPEGARPIVLAVPVDEDELVARKALECLGESGK